MEGNAIITFLNPPRLVFGAGSINTFVEDFLRLSYRRLFIITINELKHIIDDVLEPLKKAGTEIYYDTSIRAEPSYKDFQHLLNAARDFGADSVAGIGGGSVMDVAKLLAAQIKGTQPISEIAGIGKLKARELYLACLPTTAGTGSEVSPNSILIDDEGNKTGIISPFLVPDSAYIDPELTLSVPPKVTAAIGIDALSHCLEAYANKFAHPAVSLLALEGIRLISQNLLKAVKNGNDIIARSEIARGSMYGGMCLGPVNTAAVHALAYPLSTRYKVNHGLSIALLLPYVMEFNIKTHPEPYADIAQALGCQKGSDSIETALEGVTYLRELMAQCGLPSRLSEINITKESVQQMAADAIKVQRLLKNNLREISITDAENIYLTAL